MSSWGRLAACQANRQAASLPHAFAPALRRACAYLTPCIASAVEAVSSRIRARSAAEKGLG
jgi:hypothetical protein